MLILLLWGGGFGKGIHNILEDATWGIPVLFGPRYSKFQEAEDLIKCGGAISFNSFPEFKESLEYLLKDDLKLKESGSSSARYIEKNLGASEIVLHHLLA